MASGPTIVARFLADTSQMVNEVEKGSQSAGSKIKNMAKNAALAIGGAFAVDKVIEFGKASVEAAAADAESQAKLAQTIKNVTGATDAQISSNEKFISGLSKQTAIADDDLRPAMDKLVRGFGSVEGAQKALALATDVSAGSGKDLSTVTDAMMKAANGQTGALSRLGIETKNADGSAKSLDQIMKDMSKTFGGQAAKSAESAAGKIRGAKVEFGEMQEKVGNALLPVLTTLAGFFVDTLIPAFEAVGNWISDNKELIIAAFIGLGTVVAAVVIPSFIAWAVAAGAAAIATLAAAAPFIAIGAVIAAVAFLIIKNWDSIKAAAAAVWAAIQTAIRAVWAAVQAVWQAVQGAWDAVLNATRAAWNFVWNIVRNVWEWIKNAVRAAAGFIGNVMSTLGNIIVWPFKMAWVGIKQIWDWIKGAAQGAYDFMVGVFKGLANAITSPIKIAWNALAGIWNSTVGAVSIHIPDWVPGLGGKGFDVPDLPRLAGGGVLTSPTLFLGGEAGTEIVAPEAMLRAIVAEEGRGGTYTLNIYPRTADSSDIAYGFRRLELLAGVG